MKDQITIRLPEETNKLLREMAKHDIKSFSDFVRELVEKEAKRRGIK